MTDSRLRRRMASFLALACVVATGAIAQVNEQEPIVNSSAAQDEALLATYPFSCAVTLRHIDALQDSILPNWSRTLAAYDGDFFCAPPLGDVCFGESSRFKAVLNGLAVLDKETGLVWEVRPKPLYEDDPFMTPQFTANWRLATHLCRTRVVGGRYGWRLPTIEEISTLLEGSFNGYNQGAPFDLVVADIFSISPPDVFWTSTTSTNIGDDDHAYVLDLGNPASGHGLIDGEPKSAQHRWWCVRGPGY